METLFESLSPPQQHAVKLLKAALDCYNTRDGEGLFTGPGRYGVLEGRVALCAAQARDLPHFWALLLRRMRWSVPPKAADSLILPLLQGDNYAVLKSLAEESAALVMLARVLHSEDKETRKRLEAAEEPQAVEAPEPPQGEA